MNALLQVALGYSSASGPHKALSLLGFRKPFTLPRPAFLVHHIFFKVFPPLLTFGFRKKINNFSYLENLSNPVADLANLSYSIRACIPGYLCPEPHFVDPFFPETAA